MRNHLKRGAVVFIIMLSVDVAADDPADKPAENVPVMTMTASSITNLYEPYRPSKLGGNPRGSGMETYRQKG